MNNLLNPASPISPLNPINPLNPSHDYLFNTRKDTVAEVAVAKSEAVPKSFDGIDLGVACVGCFLIGVLVCLMFKMK